MREGTSEMTVTDRVSSGLFVMMMTPCHLSNACLRTQPSPFLDLHPIASSLDGFTTYYCHVITISSRAAVMTYPLSGYPQQKGSSTSRSTPRQVTCCDNHTAATDTTNKPRLSPSFDQTMSSLMAFRRTAHRGLARIMMMSTATTTPPTVIPLPEMLGSNTPLFAHRIQKPAYRPIPATEVSIV